MSNTNNLKTFVRWPGNKTKHLKKILKYIPDDYNTYIEPFIGSGSLFLYLEPEKWIINDLNTDLINIWNYVKNDPEKLIKALKKFAKTMRTKTETEKKIYCEKLTDKLNSSKLSKNKRTETYLLMLFSSFLGLISSEDRFYFKGLEREIKNDNYSFIKDRYTDNLHDVSDFLNETSGQIYNKDYRYVLSKTKKDDFVFLDPPYIEEHDYGFSYNIDKRKPTRKPTTRRQVTNIKNNQFLNTLLEEVKKLDQKDVFWLMTQADTKDVRKIFKDYTIKKMRVYRPSVKDYINELIIFNYEI